MFVFPKCLSEPNKVFVCPNCLSESSKWFHSNQIEGFLVWGANSVTISAFCAVGILHLCNSLATHKWRTVFLSLTPRILVIISCFSHLFICMVQLFLLEYIFLVSTRWNASFNPLKHYFFTQKIISRSIYNLKIDTICMCDIPFDRLILQLSNGIRHVMPPTDRMLALTAKASMAQPSHSRLCVPMG
jgi:hypothetical protein